MMNSFTKHLEYVTIFFLYLCFVMIGKKLFKEIDFSQYFKPN